MKFSLKVMKVLAPAGLLFLSCAALAAGQETGEGALQIVSSGSASELLPLRHTEVKAAISGFVAEVTVTQVFGNPSEEPIEAVYVFPLPENSAVNEMTLTVADRVIKGYIQKREEARQVYLDARAAGKTAALLEGERPNIFTQSVANIPPGGEIRVTLRYIQDLHYDDGEYRFSFPMTVGPRYIPGAGKGRGGTGWSEDTGAVPDASRITPPVTRPGKRSGRDISLELALDAGLAVKNIRSSSHEINLKTEGPSKAVISLAAGDRIPNKDFLLTYEPEVKGIGAAVLAHKQGKEGYLTLMVQPDEDFPLSGVTPKEIVIAIDVSGSMSGFPMETARATALKCLEGMNPGDTFQIMSFASGNRLYFGRPLLNTPENVARGREVLNGLRGGGGTEMLAAMRTALEFPKDPERLRILLFMTDGYIGNETQLLASVKEHLNNSRIFPLGVGSSPNRYLLEEMAILGKGVVQYVRHNETPEKLEKVIEGFYDRISRPVLTDVTVDWNGLDVKEASPAVIPDLFSGQPLRVHARYGKAGSSTIFLRGRMRGKPWKMAVKAELPESESANGAMGPLWARARITELERLNYKDQSGEAREKIVALALEHRLVTRFTSFVAVEESTSTKAGEPRLVTVESELPEGTRYEGFFGRQGGLAAAYPRYAVPGFNKAGAYAYAKFARAGVSPQFAGGASRNGGAGLAAEAISMKPVEAGSRAGKPGKDNTVAGLAAELLAAPSSRTLRKLLSLQQPNGEFRDPGAVKTAPEDQALALLAMAKANAVYASDAGPALRKAWAFMRGAYPGLNGRAAVAKALKDGSRKVSPAVWRELAALGAELKKLK